MKVHRLGTLVHQFGNDSALKLFQRSVPWPADLPHIFAVFSYQPTYREQLPHRSTGNLLALSHRISNRRIRPDVIAQSIQGRAS